MKKYLILLLACSFINAQVPQGISHRGVAYKPDGTIVNEGSITIKVSISDNSTVSGTLIYSELFNKTTNNLGQYSLNIGTGNPISPFTTTTFSQINWGTYQKFLKIEIDPFSFNGTNFTLVGTNQLMSVPYSLYAQNSEYAQYVNPSNSLRVLNNISELKNFVGHVGDVIYIKGHTIQGDGGGGNFIWRNEASFLSSTTPHSVFSDDNDGTIIQAVINGTPNDTGRWVRQFNGFIDIRFFGIPFQGGTQKLQKAIDFASYNANIDNPPTNGTTIFFSKWGLDL